MARIFIDPGHGGNDPGATLGSRKESDDCLRLSLKVKSLLEFNGQSVVMSRTSDKTMSLRERTNIENASKFDYALSIHRNAFNGSAKGIETFSLSSTGNGLKLATNIHNEVKGFFVNRGVKQANFHMLRETKAPASLIEVGFVDNSEDNKIFDSKIDEIAEAIVKGILKTVGATFNKPSVNVPVESKGFYRVIVGSYSDKSNANKLKDELVAKGYKDTFLVFEGGK